jgi:hypothetical protein
MKALEDFEQVLIGSVLNLLFLWKSIMHGVQLKVAIFPQSQNLASLYHHELQFLG